MTTSSLDSRPRDLPGSGPDRTIEIVIPIHNEAAVLARSVRRVRAYVDAHLPLHTRITVADNASTDASPLIAARLVAELDDVHYLRLEEKGRGRALRAAWSRSDADVVVYMDVDLSTDLNALAPLIAPLLSGHSELSIGTRLAPGARVVRGPKREFISRSYNHLLRTALRVRFSDAQCGFKAVRGDVVHELLAHVADEEWFFDTELLVVAGRLGMRVHEVPVDWTDDPDSRVDIVDTALKDLRGMWRIRHDDLSPRPRTHAGLRVAGVTGQVR